MQIDLNADMGEGFDDAALMAFITSASIACGVHAGSPATMEKTAALAVKHGVGIGAHPGLPDLKGFGRREMQITPTEVGESVAAQIEALKTIAQRQGVTVQHVKPHGALYHMAERDEAIAQAVGGAVREIMPSAVLVGLSGGRLVETGRKRGLRVANEVFADRAYLPNGTLVPRSQIGAILHDAAVAAARMERLLLTGTLMAIDGTELTLKADTLCVHGDSPDAPALAFELREMFIRQGIDVVRLGEQ